MADLYDQDLESRVADQLARNERQLRQDHRFLKWFGWVPGTARLRRAVQRLEREDAFLRKIRGLPPR